MPRGPSALRKSHDRDDLFRGEQRGSMADPGEFDDRRLGPARGHRLARWLRKADRTPRRATRASGSGSCPTAAKDPAARRTRGTEPRCPDRRRPASVHRRAWRTLRARDVFPLRIGERSERRGNRAHVTARSRRTSRNPGLAPKYPRMRSSAAGSMTGPTSLTTRRAIGLRGCAAAMMPRSPPIDVPTQSTDSAPLRAISATSVVR